MYDPDNDTLALEESMALFNARVDQQNERRKTEPNYTPAGRITLRMLGTVLYPGSNQRTADTSMYMLKTGKRGAVKPEQIRALCDVLKVDPNFMLHWHSQYDSDYQKLCQ